MIWPRRSKSDSRNLPTKRDFDECGCLDAQHAWKEFGGLSLEEAYAKFLTAPECYQEDFMFMGNRAFVFYFPVIDRFIREQATANDPDACDEFWIIAHAIAMHFPDHANEVPVSVKAAISDLVDFVLRYLQSTERESLDMIHSRDAVERAWRRLRGVLPTS